MLVRHISCGIGGDLRQTVTHFVLAMTCMAFNPLPADIVTAGGRIEAFPEIDVFDWLLLRRDPSVTLPAFHPERHAVFKILAVGMQDHVAGVLQTLQRNQGAHHLHPIVGRAVEALRKLALFASILENDAVTARPARIFEARAITEYFYGFELGIELDYGGFEVGTGLLVGLVSGFGLRAAASMLPGWGLGRHFGSRIARRDDFFSLARVRTRACKY